MSRRVRVSTAMAATAMAAVLSSPVSPIADMDFDRVPVLK